MVGHRTIGCSYHKGNWPLCCLCIALMFLGQGGCFLKFPGFVFCSGLITMDQKRIYFQNCWACNRESLLFAYWFLRFTRQIFIYTEKLTRQEDAGQLECQQAREAWSNLRNTGCHRAHAGSLRPLLGVQ